jgi:hypothetical protein
VARAATSHAVLKGTCVTVIPAGGAKGSRLITGGLYINARPHEAAVMAAAEIGNQDAAVGWLCVASGRRAPAELEPGAAGRPAHVTGAGGH